MSSKEKRFFCESKNLRENLFKNVNSMCHTIFFLKWKWSDFDRKRDRELIWIPLNLHNFNTFLSWKKIFMEILIELSKRKCQTLVCIVISKKHKWMERKNLSLSLMNPLVVKILSHIWKKRRENSSLVQTCFSQTYIYSCDDVNLLDANWNRATFISSEQLLLLITTTRETIKWEILREECVCVSEWVWGQSEQGNVIYWCFRSQKSTTYIKVAWGVDWFSLSRDIKRLTKFFHLFILQISTLLVF